jgi:shikimate kinase
MCKAMRNIILIGYMGSGKTTVAGALAELLQCPFIDMDTEIEKREKKSITDIFKEKGEGYFRDLETEFLKGFSEEGAVLSSGGGIVLREENIILLKKSGTVVWLYSSPDIILERLSKDESRPLLPNTKDKIEEMLAIRMPYYERACDIRIDTDNKTPGKISEEILAKCDYN